MIAQMKSQPEVREAAKILQKELQRRFRNFTEATEANPFCDGYDPRYRVLYSERGKCTLVHDTWVHHTICIVNSVLWVSQSSSDLLSVHYMLQYRTAVITYCTGQGHAWSMILLHLAGVNLQGKKSHTNISLPPKKQFYHLESIRNSV